MLLLSGIVLFCLLAGIVIFIMVTIQRSEELTKQEREMYDQVRKIVKGED